VTAAPERWDVVIGGGGPAGAAAARVLAEAGRAVLVLDPARPPGLRGIGESLPGGARPLLDRLGALEVVEQAGHRPSQGVASSWGSSRVEPAHDPARSPYGPGWHLDRARFDADLRALARAAGAELRAARVVQLAPRPGGDGWRIGTNQGELHEARFLVDATGRTAALARRLGAGRERDDDLAAVVAWVRSEDPDEARTLLEAVPEGWWYTAPLPNGERVLAFHGAARDVATLRRDPHQWAARLGATRWVRQDLEAVISGPEAALLEPLRTTAAAGARLDRFAGENWLAAGDAALAFDPLSSQGLLTALYSGVLAGEALTAALGGDAALLQDYPSRLEKIRTNYLRHHRDAYRQEGRWAAAPFWRGRAPIEPSAATR
jgi:flavin-dependent dehydrogenase